MEDREAITIADIKKRIKSSFVSLTAQQFALRAIAFVTINIILARLLPVETLGIFNIATAVVTFFAFFSDVGLAASLIQKKEKVESGDIKTAFTIQQIIVGSLSLIIIFGAPVFAEFYSLNNDGLWLVRILGVAFFLSSLKVIPAVLLERTLRFNRLVLVEMIETLIFNVLLVYLVRSGYGIWSFSVAALTKSIVGVVAIYILAPTRVGFAIEKESAKKLLSFGVPFQMNVLLALLKDRLVPLVIARMVGPAGIGYITWSQALAFLPLEVMNIIVKITFPAFSRLQEDKQSLSRAVEKSLFVTTLLSYPMLFGLAAIAPSLVNYVVSAKWQPALLSFYLFSFSIFWGIISTTLTNTLNAMGHIKTTLKLMVFWTVLTWILTPTLVYFVGFNGVAISSFLISFTSVITIVLVKRLLTIRVLNSILLPIASSLFMSIVVFLFAQNFVRDRISLVLAIALGIIIYSSIIFIFGRNRILAELRSLRNA